MEPAPHRQHSLEAELPGFSWSGPRVSSRVGEKFADDMAIYFTSAE